MQAKEIVIDAAEVVLCSACCCCTLPNNVIPPFFTTAISVVLWENSMLLLHPFPLGVRNGDFQTHLQLTPHVLVFVYWSFLTNFEGNSLEGVLWWLCLCPWGLFGWFLQRGLGWIPTCKAFNPQYSPPPNWTRPHNCKTLTTCSHSRFVVAISYCQ